MTGATSTQPSALEGDALRLARRLGVALSLMAAGLGVCLKVLLLPDTLVFFTTLAVTFVPFATAVVFTLRFTTMTRPGAWMAIGGIWGAVAGAWVCALPSAPAYGVVGTIAGVTLAAAVRARVPRSLVAWPIATTIGTAASAFLSGDALVPTALTLLAGGGCLAAFFTHRSRASGRAITSAQAALMLAGLVAVLAVVTYLRALQ